MVLQVEGLSAKVTALEKQEAAHKKAKVSKANGALDCLPASDTRCWTTHSARMRLSQTPHFSFSYLTHAIVVV